MTNEIEAWKYALDRIDKQLEIEFTLITARMSWLVISQSFLFSAYVGAGGGYIEPPGVGVSLQATMTAIGLLVAYFVKKSVEAASSVIGERKQQRAKIEGKLLGLLKAIDGDIELPSVPRGHKYDEDGRAPSRHIPVMLIIGWVVLLVVLVARFAWLFDRKAFVIR